MRSLNITTLLLLSTVVGCLPDGEDEDSGGDTDLVDLACGTLFSDFQTYAVQNRACEDVSECVVVGGAGGCGCSHALHGSGLAINREARDGVGQFWDRLAACFPDGYGICDAAPATNLRCAIGMCVADSASCFDDRDTGPPIGSDVGTDAGDQECVVPVGIDLAVLETYTPHADAEAEELALACSDTLTADRGLVDRISRDLNAIADFDGRVDLRSAHRSPFGAQSAFLVIDGDHIAAVASGEFPWPCFHDHLSLEPFDAEFVAYGEPPYTRLSLRTDARLNFPLLEDAYKTATGARVFDADLPVRPAGTAVDLTVGEGDWQYDWTYRVEELYQSLSWRVSAEGVPTLVSEVCEWDGEPASEADCRELEGGPVVEAAGVVEGRSCGGGARIVSVADD